MNIENLTEQMAHEFEAEKKMAINDLRTLHKLIAKLIDGLEGANPEVAFGVIECEVGGFYSPLDRKGIEVRLGALKERARALALLKVALANEPNEANESEV